MTIESYIEALTIGEMRFRTLRSIYCVLGTKGDPVFHTNKNEVVFEVVIEGKTALLHCGGEYEKAHTIAKIKNPYKLLTGEMLVFDTINNASWIDVIVEEHRPKDTQSRKTTQRHFVDFKECEFVGETADTLKRFCLNGKWGYADPSGNQIMSPQLSEADDFYEGRARVSLENRYGLIDREGRFVMQPQYEQLEWWGEANVISALHNGEWRIYDRMGQVLSRTSYDYIGTYSEGAFVVERCGKFGYIHTNGEPITPIRYTEAYSFSGGEGLAILNGKGYRIKK